MDKKILTITLNPSLDKTIFVKKLKLNKENRETHQHITAGGKGLNVSRCLSRLCSSNTALSFIAGNNGLLLKKFAINDNIPIETIETNGETRVNLSVVNSMNYTTRILEKGSNIEKKFFTILLKHIKEQIDKYSTICINGSLPAGTPKIFLIQLLKLANKKKINIFFDTDTTQTRNSLKYKPTGIFPNIDEASEILKIKLNDLKKIKNGLIKLHKLGAKTVVITDGKNGAYAYDGQQMLHIKVPKISAGNYTGCGDAFLAGYLNKFTENGNFSTCLKFAAACATANILADKTGNISQKTIKKLLPQITTSELK